MKPGIIIVSSIFIIISCKTSTNKPITYTKDHLKKITWIEGNWKGMDGENPFYELYEFINDSTIEITSYDWNGTDSSNSSKSLLTWNKDQYYLGENLNYNVTEITDTSISMAPNYKANNSILWKTEDQNTWIAILKSKTIEKTYKMERISHFAK